MNTRLSSLLSLATALMVALLLTSCQGGDETASEPTTAAEPVNQRTVQVETLEAQSLSFSDMIELTGTVEALRDVTVSAETSGQLSYVAPLGTRVAEGTVIARSDDRLLRSATDAAQAQYDLAEETFNRQQALYRDSVISMLEFENYRAQRNQARAQLDQALKQLEHTELQSPVGGRVEERFAEIGELASPGTPLVRIVNTYRVKVNTGIPERYAGDIKAGTPVTAMFDAYGQAPREGRVSFVSNVINPNSRTFNVEVEFDNRDGRLKPEMIAKLSILRQQFEDVVVVPQTALVRDDEGTSLYVLRDEDGALVAERREVKVGPGQRGRAVIESGLEAGERVVVVGQNTLTSGDRVEIDTRYDGVEAYLQTAAQ